MSYLINKNVEYCHQQNLQNLDHQSGKKDDYMKVLKNIGPRIDPCGTPNKILANELYEEFILVLCFLPLG